MLDHPTSVRGAPTRRPLTRIAKTVTSSCSPYADESKRHDPATRCGRAKCNSAPMRLSCTATKFGDMSVLRQFVLAASVLLFSLSASSQVPLADLAKPPASATHYVIQSTGGKHGDS